VSREPVRAKRATNGSLAAGARRRQPETGFDESAQRLRAVFEQAAVGIVCVGLDNRYLQVNRKFCEMVGYCAAELIGEPATKVSHPDERNWGGALRERLLRGEIGSFSQEKRYVRKDGAIIWVNRTESLVRDEAGRPLYYVRVIEDITRRKEIELDFEAIYEQAAVGITRVDLDGVLTGVNQKFCEMLGYAREELLGRHVREITHPADYGQGERYRGAVIRGERRSASGEKRFVRRDGSVLWARRTMSVARDSSGRPLYVISIVEDITDRKRLEMQVEQTFEQAPVGIVRADFERNILAVNARFCEMVGYSREELLQMNLQQISHPDDLALDQENRARLLSGEIASFTSEKRYVRRDGSLFWAKRTVSLAHDTAGSPGHFVFVVEDVTEQRELERRFRMIFDNAGSGIMMSDLAGSCLMVNRRFADMLGYAPEELIGRSVMPIIQPEDRASVAEQRRRLLDGEAASIAGERIYVRKDGSLIWVNRTIALVRDAAGNPLYFITVVDDVTERKRTEEELRRRNALALLVEALAVAMNQAHDPEEAMFACLTRIRDYIGWPIGHGVIFPPNDPGNAKAQVSRWVVDDPVRWRAFQAVSEPLPHANGSGGFVDRVISRREALWVDDLSRVGYFARAAAARECGLQSCFAFPVVTGERVVAFLEFYSDARVPPDRALLGAVNTIGAQLARVVERREAENALRESERFAKATIDALTSQICVIDGRGTIVAVNQAWRRFGAENGFAHDHPWEGMNYLEMCESSTGPHRGEARVVAEGIRGILSGAFETYATEYACHSEDEERWFAVRVTRFPGDGPCRLVISHENVTERTLSNRRRAMEQAVSRTLAESATVEECMPRLLRVICESLGWAYGAHWSFSESEQNLVRREFWSDFEPEFDEADREYWLRLVAAGSGGLLRRAWLDRKPTWIVDIRRDSTFKRQASALKLGLRSAYAFHIAGETGSLGVMEFFGREVRQPDAMLLEITDSIGRQIGQFVQRKRAEQALRESEERYRNLFELAPMPLLVIEDGSFKVIAVNQAAVEKYGYSRDEFLAMTAIDLQVPEDRERVELYLRQRDPTQPIQVRRRHLTKSGERIVVETARPFLVEGRRARIVLVNDVTDQVRAEEALRESEERFRATFEQAGVGMALRGVDPRNPRWLRVNQKLCDILGYSKEELLNLTSVDITPPEDREQAIEYNELLLRGELTSYSREKRYVRKDGRIIWANISLSAVKGPDGRPSHIISVIQDVTDRKRAEAALLESEEQFRQLANNIPEVFWICDVDHHRMIYVSPAFERITGRPVSFLKGEAARWIEVVHEDDRDRVRAARKDIAKGSYDEVFRVVRPGGSIRWVRDRAFPVHGPDGRVHRVTGIAEDITDRREAEEQLMFLAHYDNLTSLPNRVLFYDRLKQALSQARRNHWIVAVMFLDLDRFKNINDTLGHGAGDLLLRQVSERLTACVRSGDTVGRLSGDEFAIVLSNLSGPDDASLVAQKIMAAFNHPFNLYGKEVFVTASIGITIFPTDSTDQETLISNADTAMYRAKELGRNNFRFYTPEMNARALEKLALENSLRRALEREEFFLHFQPKVSLRSGEITGVEALLRWNHPELGVVAPSDFMPLLEETGIIVPVGVWAIRAACAQLKAWERSGLAPVPVAVNLSARQFLDKELGGVIARILEEFGVGPGLIELEITESSLAANDEEAAQTLNALNALGVRIAIDDFGTGHSSLSRLKRFPLDSLKIDGSFVRDVTADADDAAITRAIITMGHALGVAVVAEGVETEEQLAFLEANGCDEIQGYYFSRPLAAEDCAELIRSGWRLRQRSGPARIIHRGTS
jgi:diguanylate cyclase (GGDEF)-like protein/PAS domain S-box-containing protein